MEKYLLNLSSSSLNLSPSEGGTPFLTITRKADPLANKIDYRYYGRLNAAYKAERNQELTLDRWLKNGLDIQCIPKGCRADNQ